MRLDAGRPMNGHYIGQEKITSAQTWTMTMWWRRNPGLSDNNEAGSEGWGRPSLQGLPGFWCEWGSQCAFGIKQGKLVTILLDASFWYHMRRGWRGRTRAVGLGVFSVDSRHKLKRIWIRTDMSVSWGCGTEEYMLGLELKSRVFSQF